METRVPHSEGKESGSSHSSNSQGPSTRKTTDAHEAITLISFSRYPVELRYVLQNGPLLVPIKEALRHAGHSYELPSGAKLYCSAEQYEDVAAVMSRTDVDVRPYHVVFTDFAREAVMVKIGRASCRERV